MTEKRQFLRLPREWEVEYQIPAAGFPAPLSSKGVLRDLGAGGFRFSNASDCPANALIQFAIKPNSSLKPMVGVARIAWTRERQGKREYGAQFIWVIWKGEDAQKAIDQYVFDHLTGKLH